MVSDTVYTKFYSNKYLATNSLDISSLKKFYMEYASRK